MSPDHAAEILFRILPPPDAPIDQPGGGDWAAAELALGTALPPDFKDLVTRYGSGSIDSFLILLNPRSSRPAVRFGPAGESFLGGLREIRESLPDEVPFPIHPEPGGLLPWGTTDNGDIGYWVTSPQDDPGRWSIAVGEARGPGWFTHPGPLSRFLAGVLDRSIRVALFPDAWPSEHPRFHPFTLSPQRERLLRLLPPPAEPSEPPTNPERSQLEERLGLALPSDYWWFLETFGSGVIGGDLAVFSPSAGSTQWHIEAQHRRIDEFLRSVNQWRPGEVPFPIHPEHGGLLAWGGTESGVMGFWLTTHDDPDLWPVVLRDANRSEWFTHRGSLAWFLADLMDGSIDISFLPGEAARRRFDPLR